MDAQELLERFAARVPDFAIEKKLGAGAGAMGLVLLGTQRSLGRRMAAKLLFVQDADADDLARFAREARLYATLTHPNLVKIFDADASGVPAYILFEYIEGEDLRAALASAHPPDLAAIAPPLASALAYVHEHGILHRDIKSANVMLRYADVAPRSGPSLTVEAWGPPILMDFGLAKRADANATALTAEGARIGTPYYMAPEVLLGTSPGGKSADVFSLGLVFYEVAVRDTLTTAPRKKVDISCPCPCP